MAVSMLVVMELFFSDTTILEATRVKLSPSCLLVSKSHKYSSWQLRLNEHPNFIRG